MVTTAMNSLIQPDRGLIDRRIFMSNDIYQQELEQIYGRCWLLLGHESQISKPNDFVAARMGEDPILLTRDSKGKLHAFLNMCRHRGNRVCRADFGNSPSFMCTYHGWTFATDGKLVGVPGYKEAYFEELDRSQWGLVETAQIGSYRGLVFATWDANAPTLLDYLGDMAWYLDVVLDNRGGGTEAIGPTKNKSPFNWKFPSDNNGGDAYHTLITHSASAMALNEGAGGSFSTAYGGAIGAARSSKAVYAGNGHCIVGFSFSGSSSNTRRNTSPNNLVARYEAEHRSERVERLGELRSGNGTTLVFNLFPNCSGGSPGYGTETLRVLHPQGPSQSEVWIYGLRDKDAPTEVKDEQRRARTIRHGPSGIKEEEDLLNWMDCTTSSKYFAGRSFPQNLQLGLGHEETDESLPGFVFTSPGLKEANQRSFYRWWANMMDAPSWSDVKLDPIKYSKLKS